MLRRSDKWFAVRKPTTGEIIATSANQIVPPKFCGPTTMLNYIHQTPLFSCSVEGGFGDETSHHSEGQRPCHLCDAGSLQEIRLIYHIVEKHWRELHLLKIGAAEPKGIVKWVLGGAEAPPNFWHFYVKGIASTQHTTAYDVW